MKQKLALILVICYFGVCYGNKDDSPNHIYLSPEINSNSLESQDESSHRLHDFESIKTFKRDRCLFIFIS